MAIHLKNVHIVGTKVGVKAEGPQDIVAEDVTFTNVEQPWDVSGARSANIRGSRVWGQPQSSKSPKLGWRKRNGPPLPVFCPNCKSIFPSTAYNFSGAYFNVWNNEEPCPECGFQAAQLSEGVFNLARETVQILSAPDITFAMLEAINSITKDVVANNLSPEVAADRLDAVSPAFGNLWRNALSVIGSSAAAAIAAYASLYLATVQVDLAREQLQLQKESKTDDLLTKIFEQSRSMRFTLEGAKEQSIPKAHKEEAPSPSKSKPPSEPGSVKLKPKSKPKARHLRRAAKAEHRRAFGRSRHR